MDLSRLKVTAFDSNKNMIDTINMQRIKDLNFYLTYLMCLAGIQNMFRFDIDIKTLNK